MSGFTPYTLLEPERLQSICIPSSGSWGIDRVKNLQGLSTDSQDGKTNGLRYGVEVRTTQ